jgi:hypothetical protein
MAQVDGKRNLGPPSIRYQRHRVEGS